MGYGDRSQEGKNPQVVQIDEYRYKKKQCHVLQQEGPITWHYHTTWACLFWPVLSSDVSNATCRTSSHRSFIVEACLLLVNPQNLLKNNEL